MTKDYHIISAFKDIEVYNKNQIESSFDDAHFEVAGIYSFCNL